MAGPCCALAQKALVPLVTCTFLVWAITVGGIGSMQALCVEPFNNTGYLAGVRGFSAAPLGCYRIFSYYWFVVALEFIVVCTLALTVVSEHLHGTRTAFTGLLAVATVLCTQSADSFLAASEVQHYEEGFEMHTSRATAAGFIMCSVFNLFLILTVGTEPKGDAACPTTKGDQAQQQADN